MQRSSEASPITTPIEQKEYFRLRGGNLGFHYTIASELPDILRHGLLSRWEEERRGLHVRKRASRSFHDQVYFTTRVKDLHFYTEEHYKTINEALEDVVGIAIDRPDYARSREGHFGVNDFVAPDRFRALVIVDRETSYKDPKQQRDAYDKCEFGNSLPEEAIAKRVETLRRICQEAAVDLPIYGVSGDMYYPERKTRSEILETTRTRLAQ